MTSVKKSDETPSALSRSGIRRFVGRFDTRSIAVVCAASGAVPLLIVALLDPTFVRPGGMWTLVPIVAFTVITVVVTARVKVLDDRQFVLLGAGGMLGVALSAFVIADPAAAAAVTAMLAVVPAIAAAGSSPRLTGSLTAAAIALAVALGLSGTEGTTRIVTIGASITIVAVPTVSIPGRPTAYDSVVDLEGDLSSVHMRYQPIVELECGTVVGFEALARWPHLPDTTPQRVFEAATRRGGCDALDWACRVAALDGALDAEMNSNLALFVNVEPGTSTRIPDSARGVLAEARAAGLTVVLELTERFLVSNVETMTATVELGRRAGCLIALDDVGANPHVARMLDVIGPDIVKLDRTMLLRGRNPGRDGIRDAVRRYARDSGALVLAEGIETEAHLMHAIDLGAVLGQGWLFGEASPLPHDVRECPATRLCDLRGPV